MDLPSNHPAPATLEAFARGGLSDADRQSVAEHLVGCAACRTIAAETVELPAAAMAVSAEGGLSASGDRPDRTVALPPTPVVDDGTMMVAGGDTDRTIMTGGDSPPATVRLGQPREEIDGLPPDLANHPRYHVLRQLGQGGMGSVYEAQHLMMERTVALKVIRGAFTASAAAIARFRQEVRTAARLSHPNIVSALDAEQSGDTHFLIMEYVPGSSLGEYLREKGRLSVSEACSYAEQTAHGLQHAFEKGMVHRDIKPDNLMRTPGGQIKILDFGLARLGTAAVDAGEATMADAPISGGQVTSQLTSAGVVMGTPDYIAPEQGSDSHGADIRADIYSLGCTLYLMLSGRVPFPGGTPLEKIVRHTRESPQPLQQLRPELSKGLVAVVDRMLAKSPADRYQTPSEVAAALKPFAHTVSPIRRRLFIAAGVAGMAVVAGIFALNEGRRNQLGAVHFDSQSADLLVGLSRDGRTVGGINPRQGTVISLIEGTYKVSLSQGGNDDPRDFRADPEVISVLAGKDVTVRILAKPRPSEVPVPDFPKFRETPVPDSKELAARPAPADSLDPQRVPEAHRERLRASVGGEMPFPLVAVLGGRGLQGHLHGGPPSLSPNGRKVAVAARGEVVVYDTRSGDRLAQLAGSGVYRLTWYEKGRMLACGGSDGTVSLWTANGLNRSELRHNASPITSVAVSPDDVVIAAGQQSGEIQLWSALTRQHLITLQGHTTPVTALLFTRHGGTLYSASPGQLRSWDVSQRLPTGDWAVLTQDVVSLALSPDGERLAVGDDRRLRVLKAGTDEEIWSQDTAAGWVAYDPDGRSLLSTQFQPASGRAWRLRRSRSDTGELLSQHSLSAAAPVDNVYCDLSADGQTLATQEWGASAKPVNLFNARTGALRQVGSAVGHADGVIHVAFSPDGRWLASASHDLTVRVWDLSTGEERHVLRGHSYWVRSVAFSPVGLLLASGSRDQTVRLWDPVEGREVGILQHPHPVEQIAFSPDGRRLASACNRNIHVWNMATRALERESPVGHTSRVNAVAFDRNGEWLISGAAGGDVMAQDALMWKRSIRSGEQIAGETASLATVFTLPDNRRWVTAAADGTVVQGALIGMRQTLLKAGSSMTSAAVRPDGKLLAASSFDGYLRLVDLKSPTFQSVAWRLFPEDSWLHAVAFSPEGRYLATANPDGTVYLFRMAKKGEVAALPTP